MKVYFIRHNIKAKNHPEKTKPLLHEMWDRRMAVLDYEGIPGAAAFDSEKYSEEAAQHAVARFKAFCENGGYIAVVCHSIHPGEMIVGRVKPGQPLVPACFDSLPGYPFKTAQIEADCVTIRIADYPSLFSRIPRQHSFCEWSVTTEHFESALHGNSLPKEAKSLSDGQLEVLCYEYMREQGLIAELLLPIGRSLESVDIVGLNKEAEMVLAQVTFHEEPEILRNKASALEASRPSRRRSRCFMFCGARYSCEDYPDMEFVPVDKVFEFMLKRKPHLIDVMLGKRA